MTRFKFLHAADLHIDSPLKGLELRAGAPVERLRGATRRALSALVELAVQEQGAFVVLAGDLFDGPWPDMRTGIWTSQQLARLGQHNIAVYLLRGNHDAQSKVRQAVSWPDNVHEFPADKPHTFELPALGVALHGQGFSTPQVSQDLAAGYPPARAGSFNIGVLHTSLTGDPQHDTYAPTTEQTLCGRGYDYWALGHVHQRRVVRGADPFIAYCGNTQGRHIREQGAKGCLLASVEDGRLVDVGFHATDSLRWSLVELMLDEQDTLPQLYDRVKLQMEACREDAEGRFAAVRLVVRGACAAHRQLVSLADRELATAEIRNVAAHVPDVWLEKIHLETSSPLDLQRLRQGRDLLGQLLRSIHQAADEPRQLEGLADCLMVLERRVPALLKEAGVSLSQPEHLRRWLSQAEGMLVALLDEGES